MLFTLLMPKMPLFAKKWSSKTEVGSASSRVGSSKSDVTTCNGGVGSPNCLVTIATPDLVDTLPPIGCSNSAVETAKTPVII